MDNPEQNFDELDVIKERAATIHLTTEYCLGNIAVMIERLENSAKANNRELSDADVNEMFKAGLCFVQHLSALVGQISIGINDLVGAQTRIARVMEAAYVNEQRQNTAVKDERKPTTRDFLGGRKITD